MICSGVVIQADVINRIKRRTQDLAQYPLDDAPATLSALGETVAASTGGTSGALYDILLTATAAALRSGAGRAWKPLDATCVPPGWRETSPGWGPVNFPPALPAG